MLKTAPSARHKTQTPAMATPRTVLFDVYGVGLVAEPLFPGQSQALSVQWPDKHIADTRRRATCNHGAHYQPFWELVHGTLVFAIKTCASTADRIRARGQLGINFSTQHSSAVERLMHPYRRLSAFPENKEVLTALKHRGVPTGILSNGDAAMLNLAVKSAGLDGLLDPVISIDPVRKFKPHPEADALGATWFG